MSLPDGFEEGSHGASVQWVDGLCCQVEEEVEILEELRELLMVRVLLAERGQSREVLGSEKKKSFQPNAVFGAIFSELVRGRHSHSVWAATEMASKHSPVSGPPLACFLWGILLS